MDKAKASINEAYRRIDDAINRGFGMPDIPELSAMIKDIERIEKYIGGCNMAYEEEKPMDEMSRLFKNIDDELRAAEKYHKWWEESGDATFKAIGKEELKHAETLIKLARSKAAAPADTAKLQELIVWYQALLGKLA